MVRDGKPRMVRGLCVITNHYHLAHKYWRASVLYDHTFLILDSHLHPLGSGPIHTEQIPHTTQVEHRHKDIVLQTVMSPILATVASPHNRPKRGVRPNIGQRSVHLVKKNPKDGRHSSNAPCPTDA